MKQILTRICLLTLASLALFSSSCNRSSGQAHAKKFYWVQSVRGHPVHRLTQIAFAEGCHALGYGCEVVGTDELDVGQTSALAEQALSRGDAAGMAVWGLNPGFYGFIAKAGKKGVPIVIPHFPTEQGAAPGASGVISCDPAAYGHEAALAIGKQIDGKGTVAITQASFNITENMVTESFTRTMHEAFPNVKVMAPQEEGLDAVTAIAKASAILQANPDVVGACSTTGNIPPTWPSAQRATGHKVVSITMNYLRQNLDAIRDGQMYAAVAQPLWEESYQCAQLLDTVAKGGQIPWWTKLPAPLITKDNVQQYYQLLDKVDAAMKGGK